MNPIIRWAGSKRQLLGKLREFWPSDAERYIEPFCGSACLFFDIEPRSAILGDLNTELISTYRALRHDPSLIWECLRRLPTGRQAYYRIRSIEVDSLSDAELAARFLYLNRYCFNGIFRTNLQGRFNVPYGPPRVDNGFDFPTIAKAAALLKRASLVNGDFEDTLKRVECGDFVYLDPPFAVSQRRVFSEYHPASFGLADLSRLSCCLNKLDRRGAKFVVSYADSKEARQLLRTWRCMRVRTYRHIAGFARHRKSAYELMATNIEGFTHVQ
jgi:DNA adenine methylase